MSSPYDNFEVPFSLTSLTTAPSQFDDTIESVRRSLSHMRTPLFDSFFSTVNIDVVQNRLRATIQKKSGYAIDRQSDTDLLVIMRRVYCDNSNVGATDVAAEVSRLNDLVLFIVVPMVASGVVGYLAYLRDASSLPPPLKYGEQTSIKGTKTYELYRGV
jgi:hypothetical protein